MTHVVRRLLGTVTLAGLTAAGLAPGTARGDYQTFLGLDAGAGPGQPDPNYQGALTSFEKATGPFSLVTFRDVPPGPFNDPNHAAGAANATINVGQGITAVLQSVDPKPPVPPPGDHTPYVFGITGDHPGVFEGYGLPSDGPQFLRFVPEPGSAVSSVTFSFPEPVTAFGVTVTGLGGSVASDTHLVFASGGVLHDVPLPQSIHGGILFAGVAGLPKGVSSFLVETLGVGRTQRDVFAVNDVRYSTTPEPGSVVLFGLGAALLLGPALSRRRGTPA